MIRLTLLWMLVAFLLAYAWKDWFKSLCGVVLILGVVEHPDFPKSIMGIQGLNPWNLLILNVTFAWAAARSKEGLVYDLPRPILYLLALYFLVIVVAVIRMITDTSAITEYVIALGGTASDAPGTFELLSEHFINCFKWLIPAVLMFDGCRSEERLKVAVVCILGLYVALALQTIRWVPLGLLTDGDALAAAAHRLLPREVGYHRVNLAMMLGGASWAFYGVSGLFKSLSARPITLFLAGVAFFGMALTGGRMGYVNWAVIGVIFALLKWRHLLVIGPLFLAIFIISVPAVKERFVRGFTPDTFDTNVAMAEAGVLDSGSGPDLYTITSGRAFAWPRVIEKISERPLVGFGKEAMIREGVTMELINEYNESFPHPHNAYLQWTMDNGLLGAIPVFFFYLWLLKMSISLFLDEDNPTLSAVGCVSTSLILSLLIASMGSQTFYPREGAVTMWCAMALALRAYLQREKWVESGGRVTAKLRTQQVYAT